MYNLCVTAGCGNGLSVIIKFSHRLEDVLLDHKKTTPTLDTLKKLCAFMMVEVVCMYMKPYVQKLKIADKMAVKLIRESRRLEQIECCVFFVQTHKELKTFLMM